MLKSQLKLSARRLLILKCVTMKKIGKPLAIRIQQQESPSTDRLRESLNQPLRPITLPDSDEDHLKTQPPVNLNNVVEFEQFLIEDDRERPSVKRSIDSYFKPSHDMSVNSRRLEGRSLSKQLKQFSIQIPEGKGSRRKGEDISGQNFKQPPAPSNKKSIIERTFVFPEPNEPAVVLKNQSEKKDPKIQIEALQKGFDKERQQFYREKSKFQKELLVKEGQIEMLQKMLTGRFGGDAGNFQQGPTHDLQAILMEKDIQISELLQKIAELSRQLSQRGEQLHHVKMQFGRLQTVNETLLNQLYLWQKKEASGKSTQQFYDIKRQKCGSPTHRWQSVHRKQQHIYCGMEDLQQRLQNLHNNRKQLQEREKIRSQMSYSQTSKYKSGGSYETRGFAGFNRKM